MIGMDIKSGPAPQTGIKARRPCAGITLVELLIALTIIGILAAIAYPAYQEQIRKSRRTDGTSPLLEMMARQERFYTDNDSYTVALNRLGYTLNDEGKIESPEGYYQLSADECDDGSDIDACVKLIAEGQNAQETDEVCSTVTLNSRNVRAPAACW